MEMGIADTNAIPYGSQKNRTPDPGIPYTLRPDCTDFGARGAPDPSAKLRIAGALLRRCLSSQHIALPTRSRRAVKRF